MRSGSGQDTREAQVSECTSSTKSLELSGEEEEEDDGWLACASSGSVEVT